MSTWYSLSLMLHLIAIALWLGGIVFFLVVSGPAVYELEPHIAIKTMNQGRIGLERISWTAIALLLLTGIVNLVLSTQTAAAPLGESYIILLGAKLFLFGAMALHHSLQVFKYAPRIAALTAEIKPTTTEWPEPLLSQWRGEPVHRLRQHPRSIPARGKPPRLDPRGAARIVEGV